MTEVITAALTKDKETQRGCELQMSLVLSIICPSCYSLNWPLILSCGALYLSNEDATVESQITVGGALIVRSCVGNFIGGGPKDFNLKPSDLSYRAWKPSAIELKSKLRPNFLGGFPAHQIGCHFRWGGGGGGGNTNPAPTLKHWVQGPFYKHLDCR